MKIKRTIPPAAAAPVRITSFIHGITGMLLGEKCVRRLENEVKEYFGVRHVFLASSGKAALFLILEALQSLKPDRQKVLIPAYTCFSVPSVIVKAGLKISLCDIDLTSFDFDTTLLKTAINDETLCVVPNHLFGIPSDVDAVRTLCRDKGAFVVEDAAQAMGGSHKGKKIGTFGDVAFFSLGRGKNITCGSGGIIITDSDEIAEAIRNVYAGIPSPGIRSTIKEFLQVILMSVFIRPFLYWFPSGLPQLRLGETIFHRDFRVLRFSGMKAGLLWKWQERLERSNQSHSETAVYFSERLNLKLRGDGQIPYLRLPLIVDNKSLSDNIYSDSYEKGLGVSLMYPAAVNEIKEIKGNFKDVVCPAAGIVPERLLMIPTHRFLSEKDKKAICLLFERHLREAKSAELKEGKVHHEACNYN